RPRASDGARLREGDAACVFSPPHRTATGRSCTGNANRRDRAQGGPKLCYSRVTMSAKSMQRATFLAIALAANGCGNSPHDTDDARADAPAQDGATPGDAVAQDGTTPDDGSPLDATSGTDASVDSAPADDGASGGDARAQPHI